MLYLRIGSDHLLAHAYRVGTRSLLPGRRDSENSKVRSVTCPVMDDHCLPGLSLHFAQSLRTPTRFSRSGAKHPELLYYTYYHDSIAMHLNDLHGAVCR